MVVRFAKQFHKDISIIKDSDVITNLHQVILSIEKADNFKQIKIYKKLQGSKIAYAIRINDYRLGLYFENNIIELSRFLHRKEIYRYFPGK